MAWYEVLYGGEYISLIHWDEVDESKLVGPEILQQTEKIIAKIKQRIKDVQERKKSYTDIRMNKLEFEKSNKECLKVATRKILTRFEKKRKLSLHFNIGAFEILERGIFGLFFGSATNVGKCAQCLLRVNVEAVYVLSIACIEL